MSDDEEKRCAEIARDLYERLSDTINESQQKAIGHLDPKSETYDAETHLWGKALLAALARHVGVIEAALTIVDGLDYATVRDVRELWIHSGHKVFNEATEAAKAEEQEN